MRGDLTCGLRYLSVPQCRSKVRSSYSSEVESSCSKAANWSDDKTGDAGVKRKRPRLVEGAAGGQAATPYSKAGWGASGGERSMGAQVASPGPGGRGPGPGDRAPPARLRLTALLLLATEVASRFRESYV